MLRFIGMYTLDGCDCIPQLKKQPSDHKFHFVIVFFYILRYRNRILFTTDITKSIGHRAAESSGPALSVPPSFFLTNV